MTFTLSVPPDFQSFDPRGEFWNYERNLPHWRQPGVTYFVTFSLSDSLPVAVVNQIKRERDEWERLIAQHEGRLLEELQINYASWQRRSWVAAERVMDESHGSCLLRDPAIREIVSKALMFFEGDRSSMHAFVVMPNHVHAAVQSLGEWQIEEVLKSWKGFTARVINESNGGSGELWQGDNWNRIIRDEDHWRQVVRYILRNPEKAKLREGEFTVWQAERTRGSSSRVREDERVDAGEVW